ncbi:MAG: ATP-binding protein [Acidimicrobiales bacterium]
MAAPPPQGLRFWQKLAAIFVAFAIPLALTTYLLIAEMSVRIELAGKALDGDRYLRVVSGILQDISTHRVLDRRQIAGESGLEAQLATVRARVDANFRELAAVDGSLRQVLQTGAAQLAAAGRSDALPASLADRWNQIKGTQKALLTSERLHAELISGVRSLIGHIGDTSTLVLDPDLRTYYVMDAIVIREPELFDQLGRVGDLVDAMQERVNVSPNDRARLAGAASILQLHADQLEENLRTAFTAGADPAPDRMLEPSVSPLLVRAVSSIRRVAELTTQQVVQPAGVPAQTDDIAASVQEAVSANAALWEELFDQHDTLLEARKDVEERRRLVALSGVGLVVVLIIALTAAMARRISRDVGSVSRAAQALAAGDLGRRAEVRSRGEVGALAEAFNVMAERLETAYATSEEKVRTRTLELQQNAASLELLQRVAVAANEAVSHEDATATTLELVCEFAGFPIGHAYLVREGPDGPQLASSGIWQHPESDHLGAFRRSSEDMLFEAGVGLPGRVLASGEPAWIADLEADENFPRSPAAREAGITSAMAFPVLVGREVVAVLEFFSRDDPPAPRHAFRGAPDRSLVELMGNVGTQLGRVIERWRAQDELRKSKEAAESASQTKSAFLASMSHELRTPLNAIIGYSEMIEEDLTALGHQDLVADQEKIRQSGRHLLGVIDDILDLSKIEAGRMDVVVEAFDVVRMLDEVQAAIRPVARRNGNELRVEVAAGLGQMRADPTKVRQALLNLLSNAAKFTENGTIVLRATRSVEAGLPWLSFEVSDTGIGMTPPQMERLFEPFSQADSSTTRRYGGTGLGLFISRHVCRMMGGDITCTSEIGVGSTFAMRLPAGTSVDPGHAGDGDSDGDVGALGASVLVVDDDAQTRELLRRLLDAEGLSVALADSGRTALTRLEARRPSFVLLDLMMPEMDGFEFLVELGHHPEWRTIPVVVLTAKDLTTDERERLAGQVERILRKGSYSRQELLSEVRARVAASTGAPAHARPSPED